MAKRLVLALVAMFLISGCLIAQAQEEEECKYVYSEECGNNPCADVECPEQDGKTFTCFAISCAGDTDSCYSECVADEDLILESGEEPAEETAEEEPASEADYEAAAEEEPEAEADYEAAADEEPAPEADYEATVDEEPEAEDEAAADEEQAEAEFTDDAEESATPDAEATDDELMATTGAPDVVMTTAIPSPVEAEPVDQETTPEMVKRDVAIDLSATHEPWTLDGPADGGAAIHVDAAAGLTAEDHDIIAAASRDTARAVEDAVRDPASSNWGTGSKGLETVPVVWTMEPQDGKCPAGYYLDTGVCRRCAQGHVRAEGAATCTICGPGTFADVKLQICRPCALGNYSYWHASTRCLWCLPGNYADQLGSTKCKQCPEGTHSGYQAAKCT
ncbi:MAG: hypothetical protein J3K34DRAFT_416256 [Monoraphidium minutum]|nr:MAG: hypothetical protein J3K34DRAFT_416256 [Monoraphidium minutum]